MAALLAKAERIKTARGLVASPFSHRLAPLLWASFLLLRVDGWGLFDGVPLRSLEASALAVVLWLYAFGRPLAGGAWLPAVLLAFKIAAGAVLVPQGFVATYYANASWTPPYERSPEYPWSDYTRIDRTLQFDSPAGPHLPLYFFNDNTRFNYYGEGNPGRGELPFSVQWEGDLWSSSALDTAFVVRGQGLEATLLVDGEIKLTKDAVDEHARGAIPLPPGWVHLTVRIAAPSGRARAFEISVDRDGTVQPLGQPGVYTRALSASRLRWDRGVRFISRSIDIALLALIAWCATTTLARMMRTLVTHGVRDLARPSVAKAWLAVGFVAAFSDSLAFARLVDGRLLLLSGGNDMLTYETFARDISINGPLMLLGQPRGHAEPFYFQPLYPYFLAAAHLLFGEDAFGVFLFQRLGLWISLFALGSSTRLLFSNLAAVSAVVAGGLFMYLKVLRWSGVQLSEVLFIPLVCLSLRSAIVLASGVGTRAAIATGLFGGLATLTRSTFAIAWAVALPLASAVRRTLGISSRAVLLSGLVLVTVLGLATLRNAVAARRFVPLATSGSVVLLLGNPPPPGTPAHEGQPHALFRWLGLDERTKRVAEGALHQPTAFAANLVRKALYTLGFFGAYVPGTGWSPILVMTWSAALFGLVGRRHAFARDARGLMQWLPAVFAASHFVAVTVFVPYVYADRLILPFYVLLIPYVGACFDLMTRAVSAPSTAPEAQAVG